MRVAARAEATGAAAGAMDQTLMTIVMAAGVGVSVVTIPMTRAIEGGVEAAPRVAKVARAVGAVMTGAISERTRSASVSH